MQAEMKIRWLEALRSGKYVQGKEYLRDKNDQYCCWGVFCDLLDPNGWVMKPGQYGYDYKDAGRCYPKNDILHDYDIPVCYAGKLARMNDHGSSFLKIADVIEGAL